MANKYDELSNKIINLIGGQENISFFTHCITRLRFNLKDRSLTDITAIGKLKGVIGVQWQGDQLQIIIGQEVDDAYRQICLVNHLKEETEIVENLDPDLKKTKKKLNIKQSLLVIVDCMAPIFPLLIGASLLKCLCILLSTAGWVQESNITYQFFYQAASAGMYYFPIFLGATSAKRFGANQGLGMLMGAMLVFPEIQSLLNSGQPLAIFGVPVTTSYVYYASSIIPAILIVWVMSKVEKFLNKYLPAAFKSMLTPFLTLCVMIPLGFCVLGPVAAIVGAWFSTLINGIYNTFGLFAVAALSAAFPWIVSTGMHSAVLPPYYMWALSTMGYDPITKVAAFLANINVGCSGLACAIKFKDPDKKAVAISAALPAILAGTSEPVIFGVDLKYMKPMYGASVGGLIGGLIAGAMKVKGYAGQNSILVLVTFGLGGPANLFWMVIAVVVGAIVSFVVTLILIKKGDLDD